MPTKVVFCKNNLCGTDKLDIERLQEQINKTKIDYFEIENLCGNFNVVNQLKSDLIIVGCSGKVIKPKIKEKDKRIVFADVREQCLWVYNDPELLHREILLQIKLAFHRLRFQKKCDYPELNCFNEKVTEYVNLINELGPNPFKM